MTHLKPNLLIGLGFPGFWQHSQKSAQERDASQAAKRHMAHLLGQHILLDSIYPQNRATAPGYRRKHGAWR